MWKGWLCVPAIYSKGKYFHSRLAVSVIVRGSLLGRLAYKFAVASISANLYPQKAKCEKRTHQINKKNLMNSNKQSSSTIKNTLIPEEPCTPYQNPPPSVTGWN